MKKKLILIISVNVLLVTLAVLLSYRMMAPRFEAKQITNLNSLGSLHTEAAAEKIASFVSLLKDELKENGIRLIDPSRGPIFLDPSRWLWLRVQDKEWRAEGNLDALPLPNTDVDTWGLRQNKNSLILSQRIPVMKEGVQDFVLIEGGFKLSAFSDLQSDNRFGLWVFDLNSYKKGGLSSAKIFERGGAGGILDKEEMASMTSDFLNNLFNSNQSQELKSNQLWQVYFKKSLANDQLGILGFWTKETEPQGLSPIWLTLIASLITIAALSSFLIYKILDQSHLSNDADNLQVKEESRFSSLSQIPTSLPGSQQQAGDILQFSKSNDKQPVTSAVSKSSPPKLIKDQKKKDIQRFMKGLCADLGNSLEGKSAYSVERLLLFMEDKEPPFENFDIEIASHEFQKNEFFPKIETFFDSDIWRVHSNSSYLKALLSLYADFLKKNSAPGEIVRLSARYCSQDLQDMDCVDLKRSIFFKEPFNRVNLSVVSKEAFTKKRISEFFDLSPETPKIENVELPFSLDAVENLHARLKMKSNSEEGHVIYLDIPACEARRPEDIVFIKQLKGLIPDAPVSAVQSFDDPVEKIAPTPKEELAPEKQNLEESKKALRLSEIEKISSFAEGISDERTRARSRFKIKRPGEKS